MWGTHRNQSEVKGTRVGWGGGDMGMGARVYAGGERELKV